MNKENAVKIGLVCLIFLVLAGVMEKNGKEIKEGNCIERNEPGEAEKKIAVNVSGDELDDYEYELIIPERRLTYDEAKEYFEAAENEIEEGFYEGEEGLNHVTERVNIRDYYVHKMVSADWSFSESIISEKGEIDEERLGCLENSEDGILINTNVTLACQEYEEEYDFSFIAFPKELSKKEVILKAIDEALRKQFETPGEEIVTLPSEIDGSNLIWKEKKQYLIIKVLIFEVIIVVLVLMAREENKKEELKKRKKAMELEYSEVVSKMAILLGSGMSIKQAWSRISARYLDKRNKNQTEEIPIYEEILITEREIEDGKSERIAYQNFGERVDLSCYHRLSRILVSCLERGSRQICETLEKESEDAFESRKLLAKKLGEEASTKMLAPLMLMMMIVIAIVIVPALLNFQ